MDGENNGKPLLNVDDFGVTPIFEKKHPFGALCLLKRDFRMECSFQWPVRFLEVNESQLLENIKLFTQLRFL